MTRFLIADDHAVVRRGLIQILAEAFHDAAFGEASSSTELMEKVRAERWNLITLDIGMPGKSGLYMLGEIRQLYPHLPVLVLSVHPEDQYAMRALKAGAAGYLMKDSAPTELVSAVQKVLRGGRYVSPTLGEMLATGLVSNNPQQLHESLSARELEVLRLLASGKTMSEIADTLALSPKTVSTYRARLLLKLGLHSNAELIRYAVNNNLTE